MCGRLRCCLIYEYEQYVEARKQLPKRNKHVVTPRGEGKVMDVLPMSNKVIVCNRGRRTELNGSLLTRMESSHGMNSKR